MSSSVIRNNPKEATKVVPVISQKDLKAYLNAKARVEKLATMFHASLKLGAKVEEGAHTAYLDTGEEKRPNWRGALLERCGDIVVKEVRDNTEPKPYERLRVK
jgi:hypothetical protein